MGGEYNEKEFNFCKYRAFVFVCFPVFLFSNSVGALDVIDPISVDQTWSLADSPVNVLNDITVNSGAVLTIDAGVTVKFNENVALTIVDGSLIARGTSQALITFTSNNPAETWRHIKFETAAVDAIYDGGGNYMSGSILEHAVIEKAGNQLGTAFGAIQLSNAHPFLSNLTVQNNSACGIYGDSISQRIVVKDSDIISNTDTANFGGAGIFLDGLAGSEALIQGNTISNNTSTFDGGGISVSNIDVVNIKDNTLSSNQSDTSGGGVYLFGLQDTAASSIEGNVINNNIAMGFGGGMQLDNPGTSLTIVNNKFIDNDGDQGGGLQIENDPTGQIVISKNYFVGNNAGDNGGSMNIEAGTHTLLHNIFYLNTSSTHAAGLDIHSGFDLQTGLSTVVNNVFANNVSPVQPLNLPGVGVFNSNAVIANVMTQTTGTREGIAFQDIPSATGNLFAYNDVNTKNFISFVDPLAVDLPNFTGNNFLENTSGFLLANVLSTSVDATNNWWGTTDQVEIDSFVFTTSAIDTLTPAQLPLTSTPVSPPTGVSVVAGVSEISVSWDADVSGYTVYWGAESAPDYTDSQAVGNVTSFIIPSLIPGSYFVAVTADDGGAVDDSTTFINERQTTGNESWFSTEQQATLFGTDLALSIVASSSTVSVGGAVTFTVTVTNNGPITANNIVVSAAIPVNASFVSASTGCATNAGTVSCSVAALASTAPDNTISFAVTLNAPDTVGVLSLSASVTANEFDLNTANDIISIDTTVNAASGGGGGIFSPWLLLLVLFSELIQRRRYILKNQQ